MKVYKGAQPFREFVQLETHGALGEPAMDDPVLVRRRLAVLATRVVEDLGPHASWSDLKDTLKARAAGRLQCAPDAILTALEGALRVRGQATT